MPTEAPSSQRIELNLARLSADDQVLTRSLLHLPCESAIDSRIMNMIQAVGS